MDQFLERGSVTGVTCSWQKLGDVRWRSPLPGEFELAARLFVDSDRRVHAWDSLGSVVPLALG
jgi:hypothetical protein